MPLTLALGAVFLISVITIAFLVAHIYRKKVPILTISYEKRDSKYVFEKEGVYFALTRDQIDEMKLLTNLIIQQERTNETRNS